MSALESPVHWPADWPTPGPIDLVLHDRPHASSTTEWWYLHTHLETASGRKLSLFVSFFRVVASEDEVTGLRTHAHSLIWAIADASAGTYSPISRVDADAPRMGLLKLERGEGTRDPRLRRAIREVLERGNVPHPDQMFTGPIRAAEHHLDLDFDGARLQRGDDGSYHLNLLDAASGAAAELVFRPQMPALRHGEQGVVKSVNGEDMFYYFVPRNAVSGTVRAPGAENEVVSGSGWYDHEFGHPFATTTPVAPAAVPTDEVEPDIAWNWIAVQLEDGSAVTAYTLYDLANDRPAGQGAVIVPAEGAPRTYRDLTLQGSELWRSTRTFNDYPTHWRLEVPEAGLILQAQASFPDQEFITVLSKPAFWEGRVDVCATRDGQKVLGTGFVERSGYSGIEDLDSFFKAVGESVRRSVRALLPFDMSRDQLQDLVSVPDRPDYIDGVDTDRFVDTMVRPIRHVVDRGGKSWRSYAALCCCDVVGGDSRGFAQWLAMPELMHSGSLIVDDVQDRSEIRRGGPTAHLIYGDAIAINAGTAGYFLGQKLLFSDDVSPEDRLRLYDLYFLALRAGHAGQALDLAGFDELLDAAVEQGDGSGIEDRVLAVHRLKTAVPAASLARMGAVVGGGDDAQIEGVGRFFEDLGLAFQIIDDVLNLRGFARGLKVRGEDLAQGKVTLPVARALSRLDLEDRRWLIDSLRTEPEDQELIDEMIECIEDCGALEQCSQQAAALVEAGWARLDPLVPDSLPKLMLRAFGWYVLDRHY